MASLIKINGIEKVIARLRKEKAKTGAVSAIVGYSTNYAIYVHENLKAHHPVGQAKFLEQPARVLRKTLISEIMAAYKAGATLSQSVLRAALRLQRESQKLVPVLTGTLRNSAFTRLEK